MFYTFEFSELPTYLIIQICCVVLVLILLLLALSEVSE